MVKLGFSKKLRSLAAATVTEETCKGLANSLPVWAEEEGSGQHIQAASVKGGLFIKGESGTSLYQAKS